MNRYEILAKQQTSLLLAGMRAEVKRNFTKHERGRLERAMVRCKMHELPHPKHWDAFPKVQGRTVCNCGQFYKDHPDEWRLLDKFNRPYLKILCNGMPVRILK